MAGADAVYAGGPRFGARAFADNFSEEELLHAIDEAHLHGKRFYLTVNTLIKERELPELRKYLIPLYEEGLDAVIVQDTGALNMIRDEFPEMDIHASTQMTITGASGAAFLKEKGVVRVVPARELSLAEVRQIKDATGMEVECFVHGALCYCYSGQCLLSSLLGGRSGNRGQCAQPCRLLYEIEGEKGYFLSLKDICTVEMIPQLIEAGIDSFKIEGRMKRPEYVAGVTSVYRKYTDKYLEGGKKTPCMSVEDKEMLLDLYNRGGFQCGYYTRHNGPEMVAVSRPNHAGTAAVKVLGQRGREISGQALTNLHKGDVIEFPGRVEKHENYTLGRNADKHSEVMLLAPVKQRISKGTVLYRIKNPSLLEALNQQFLFGKKQEKMNGYLTVSAGKPATLIVCCGDKSAEAKSEMCAEKAAKAPLDRERVRQQMMKTGNTPFCFETLEITLEGDVFLPMQQMNEMRRSALEKLEKEIVSSKRRVFREQQYDRSEISGGESEGSVRLSVLVSTKEQLMTAADYGKTNRIYIESTAAEEWREHGDLQKTAESVKRQGTEVFFASPYIFRDRTQQRYEQIYDEFIKDKFDGVLVRNFEFLHFLKEHEYVGKVVLDQNMYVMNSSAKQFWQAEGYFSYTAPFELNHRELKELNIHDAEMVIYGYQNIMVSAQCVTKTVQGCDRSGRIRMLKDRYQKQFPVKPDCRNCYNVIYNSVPLCLFHEREILERLSPRMYRLQFSVESRSEMRYILAEYEKSFIKKEGAGSPLKDYTKGHFRRGIT